MISENTAYAVDKIGTGLNILGINAVKFNIYSPVTPMTQILRQHFCKGGESLIILNKIMEQITTELAALPLIGNVQQRGDTKTMGT